MRRPMAQETTKKHCPSWTGSLLPLLLLTGMTGCAATQMIGLDVAPERVVVFVDGERLEGVPREIELTSNRDHTLFFQREGYLSQLIVVRTTQVDGEPHLAPERVKLLLRLDATTAPNVSVDTDEKPAVP